MQRSIRAITLLMIFVCLPLFAGEGKVNFSGKWTLDRDKSGVGGGRRGMASSKLIIQQENNKLIIDRVFQRRSGEEFNLKEELSLDGKETKSEMFNGTRKSRAKWSSDGKVLIINSVMTFERNGREFNIESTEEWSLSDNGKALIISFTHTTPRGERTGKLVYNKSE